MTTPDTPLSLVTLAVRFRKAASDDGWTYMGADKGVTWCPPRGRWEVEPLVSGPEAAARIRDLERALEEVRAKVSDLQARVDLWEPMPKYQPSVSSGKAFTNPQDKQEAKT